MPARIKIGLPKNGQPSIQPFQERNVIDVTKLITDVFIEDHHQIETLTDVRNLFRRAPCLDDINRCAKKMSVETYVKLRLMFNIENAQVQLNLIDATNNIGMTRLEQTIKRLGNGQQSTRTESTDTLYWERTIQRSKRLLAIFLDETPSDSISRLEIDEIRKFYKKLVRKRV